MRAVLYTSHAPESGLASERKPRDDVAQNRLQLNSNRSDITEAATWQLGQLHVYCLLGFILLRLNSLSPSPSPSLPLEHLAEPRFA